MRILWAHFAFSLILAFWYKTFLPALLIGLPASAVVTWLAKNQSGSPVVRCASGAALMIYSALFIQQTHGLTEMHFHVFCALAFLVAYRDWRVIVTAVVVAASHHAIFTALQMEGTKELVTYFRLSPETPTNKIAEEASGKPSKKLDRAKNMDKPVGKAA